MSTPASEKDALVVKDLRTLAEHLDSGFDLACAQAADIIERQTAELARLQEPDEKFRAMFHLDVERGNAVAQANKRAEATETKLAALVGIGQELLTERRARGYGILEGSPWHRLHDALSALPPPVPTEEGGELKPRPLDHSADGQLIAQARALNRKLHRDDDLATVGMVTASEGWQEPPGHNYWSVRAVVTPKRPGVKPYPKTIALTQDPNVAGLLCFVSTGLDRLCDLAEAALPTQAPQDVAGLVEGDEVGWLIEAWNSKSGGFRAEWWSLDLPGTEDGHGWTKDSTIALRFARQRDAQDYINDIGWTEAKPTEHRWGRSSAAPQGVSPDCTVTTTVKNVWSAGCDWGRFGRESRSGTYDEVVPKAAVEILALRPSPISHETTKPIERCAHCVAVDGPHKPGEQRFWLARKLMDSKLSDTQAFSVVRHHPDISESRP